MWGSEPSTTMGEWTTVGDLRAALRRRWDSGELLSAYAAGAPPPPRALPIRGPRAGEISDRLTEVRSWRDSLVAGSAGGAAYELVEESVGGRVTGRNVVPRRALVRTYPQAWRLLGVGGEVGTFDALLALTREQAPELVTWVAEHPRRVLRSGDAWPAALAAYGWLRGASARGAWLRQIEAPGVDTKFVEQHHTLLRDLLLAGGAQTYPVEGASGALNTFARQFGLRTAERLVHLRFNGGFAGLPSSMSEGSFRLNELAAVRVGVQTVVVVENQQTFQVWPVPAEGVVIWGAGYLASRLARLPWVVGAPHVWYSGDLDTHGFAILSGLRAGVPRVSSLAMDRDTLLRHRERWGQEPSPTSARLPHLTRAEAGLYQDLVEDTFGERVRLEQERLDWTYVTGLIEAHGVGE